VALTPEHEREWIAKLEEMGVTQVRSLLDQNKISPIALVNPTAKWLSDKDREAKAKADALQSEQMGLMRRQADAAERANTRATIAIWVAGASLIVSIVFSILTLLKH